jgi:hypothetical protein
MVFESCMQKISANLPSRLFSFKPKKTLFPMTPQVPDQFETQTSETQEEKATDEVSSILHDVEQRLKVRAKQRAENKKRAEKLLVWDIVESQAQGPAPTSQTIDFARRVLKYHKSSYLRWVGLRDQAYIDRLQTWLHKAEESYAKNPEIRPTDPAVLAQISKARTHLDYEDKILNGFEVDSDSAGIWNIFKRPGIHIPVNMDTIQVDRVQDARLKFHLKEVANKLKTDPELNKLRNALQGQTLSQKPEEEVESLVQLLEVINHPFRKLNADESGQLSDQLKAELNKNNSFAKQFGLDLRIGKLKIYSPSNADLQAMNIVNPYIPLGTFLEAGAGVCRHRALWTKVLVDDLSQGGIKASFHYGWFAKVGGHAWNQIRFPNGREYLFDPMNDLIFDLSNPAARKEVRKLYTQRTDTAWDIIGWPWEAGKQFASNALEKMKALNPFSYLP